MKKIHTVSGKNVSHKNIKPFTTHHQFLIVGGGTAGITVAAQLSNKLSESDIAVIEPSEVHYYQPMWTFNGAGVLEKEKSKKLMKDVMPGNVAWIKDRVVAFHPEENSVETAGGRFVSYDYLVVAPGIQLDWDKVAGLSEGIGTNGICSVYTYRNLDYVHECIKNLKRGVAIFTQPNTKFKCGGAPQKIMYLAADTWRKHGNLKNIDVKFISGGSVIFGVKEVASALKPVIERYGIQTSFMRNLKAVDAKSKVAIFDIYNEGHIVDEESVRFDMLHVTPPQSSPDFIKKSVLANADGWVDVDMHSLQHVRYPNIFSLGDACSTPNAKTGAAIRKQSKVVTGNLLSLIKTGAIDATLSYDGYGSCPLITGYGKLILAEFDYNNKITPSFPVNQMKERRFLYYMKKDLLPIMYWQGMLKGRA